MEEPKNKEDKEDKNEDGREWSMKHRTTETEEDFYEEIRRVEATYFKACWEPGSTQHEKRSVQGACRRRWEPDAQSGIGVADMHAHSKV